MWLTNELYRMVLSHEPFEPDVLDRITTWAIDNNWDDMCEALAGHPGIPPSADDRLRLVTNPNVRIAWLTHPDRPEDHVIAELQQSCTDALLAKVIEHTASPSLLEKLGGLCRGKKSLAEMVLNPTAPTHTREQALKTLLARPGPVPHYRAISDALAVSPNLRKAAFTIPPYNRFEHLFERLGPEELVGMDGSGLMTDLVLKPFHQAGLARTLGYAKVIATAFPDLPELDELRTLLEQKLEHLERRAAGSATVHRNIQLISSTLHQLFTAVPDGPIDVEALSADEVIDHLTKLPQSHQSLPDLIERLVDLICDKTLDVTVLQPQWAHRAKALRALGRRRDVPTDVIVAVATCAYPNELLPLLQAAEAPLDAITQLIAQPNGLGPPLSQLVDAFGEDVIDVYPAVKAANRSQDIRLGIRYLIERVGPDGLDLASQLAEGSTLTFGELAELVSVAKR